MPPHPDDRIRELQDDNPYSIPETSPGELAPDRLTKRGQHKLGLKDQDLSSLVLRFAGNLIDSIPFILIYVVLFFMVALPEDSTTFGGSGAAWVPVVAVVGSLVYLGVTIYLNAVRSQSIGKYMLGMQIVTANGKRAGFARIFFLRFLLILFINAVMGCFAFIDPILIFFTKRRQCLHDLIASTYVVKYRPDRT